MKHIIKRDYQGSITELNIISIHKVLENFLNEFDSKNTRKNYKRYVAKYIKFMNIETINDFRTILYAEVRSKSTEFIKTYRATSTKRFVKSILSSFWNYIIDVYNYPKNPIPKKIQIGKVHNKSNTPSLKPSDLSAKLKKLYKYRMFSQQDFLVCTLATTLAGTGLRISEVLQITTDMVKNGEIIIKAKRGNLRVIELPIEVKKLLEEYAVTYNIAGEIFKTSWDNLIDRTNASKLLKKHTGIAAHGFRKSVIEGLIESGVHNHEVAKVSGHSSINMVFYYDNRDTKTNAHKDFMKSLLQ